MTISIRNETIRFALVIHKFMHIHFLTLANFHQQLAKSEQVLANQRLSSQTNRDNQFEQINRSYS